MITEETLVEHAETFRRQRGRLHAFVCATTTVSFSSGGQFRQICQVGFNSDGSIRLAWPYLPVREGIVSEVNVPNDGKSHRVEMHERGRFTSQLVKFSHHVSGRAHFSMSGKVRSDVGRDSFRLDGPIGRIFELTVIYPEHFKPLQRLKGDRLYAHFTGKYRFPDALQIRGEWRRRTDIIKSTSDKRASVGPVAFAMHRRVGETAPTVFLAPPLGARLRHHLLMVSCHPTALPVGATQPGVIFIGAFDHHEVLDASGPMHLGRFLAAMFPTDATDDVKRAVGSIDLE